MCEEINQFKLIKNISKAVVIATALLFVFHSCDESKPSLKGKVEDSLITTRLYNAKITLKDSGYEKVFVRSPEIDMYELLDTPFTVCPFGLELNYYKVGKEKPGYLRASYAKIIEKKKWYEARGNVVVVNPEGDSLKTQTLFWNQVNKQIYTPDTTYIIRADGTFLTANNGMEASDDFASFKFFNNSKGRIFVKDN